MTPVIACDISEYQPPVTDAYPHRWLIFRACDGDYVDRNAGRNLAWAIGARKSGKLLGFTVYVVYRPGQNAAITATLDRLGVPRDCVIMIDAEAWGGQIRGDHSTEINALATALRARQGGRADLVWAYGNRGPDLTVWPSKPAWLGWVIASYGGSPPSAPNLVGWQYTDGQWSVPGLPVASAPFGHCDHNVIYKLPTSTPEDDMSAADVAAITKHIDQQAAAITDQINRVAVGIAKAITAAIHGDATHPDSLASIHAELDALVAKEGQS